MERINACLWIICIAVGSWGVMNGILHDTFILLQGRKYDRELLRLLMDGHILITCGLFQILSYKGILQNQEWGYYFAGIATMSLLIYCFMIFPFLKSFGIITLNVSFLILLILSYFTKDA